MDAKVRGACTVEEILRLLNQDLKTASVLDAILRATTAFASAVTLTFATVGGGA